MNPAPALETADLDIATALDRMEAVLHPVGTATAILDDALGRVSAATIAARLDAPPFAVAAMDGYALRWIDAAEPLTCTGLIKAGDPVDLPIAPGTCRRIFTGAHVPPEADTVVIQERAERTGDRVIVLPGAEPHRHIRALGSNFRLGDAIIRPGRRLTARDIGLLAGSGHLHVRVYRRPQVAVLSTGDELSESLTRGGASQIIDANRPALKALIRAWGGTPVDLGIIPDDPDALSRILSAVTTDLLVISGGASVGAFDFVGPTLTRLRFDAAFRKVRMRPGKAVLFGTLGTMPILGLPGNVCAALTGALVFLKPALSLLAGAGRKDAAVERAVLEAPLAAVGPRTTFLRGRLGRDAAGGMTVTVMPEQDNAMLSALAAADALIVRAPSADAAGIGDGVDIIRFDAVGGF